VTTREHTHSNGTTIVTSTSDGCGTTIVTRDSARVECWACNGSGLRTYGFGNDTRVRRDLECEWCGGRGTVAARAAESEGTK